MRLSLLLVLLPLTAAAEGSAIPARLDELWRTRDDAASIEATNQAIKDGNQATPTDYDFLWRAARFRWWQADGEGDSKKKRIRAKEGWGYADRALAARPDGFEGKYYTALAIGAYSQAVGVLQALAEGLEGKFVSNLEAAGAASEDFDRAGAHTAKGRYHWELPWPKRDLKASRTELKKSIALHPEHLRNYYYLAQTELTDGDVPAAKAAVAKVLDGDPSYDPPEARRVKAWATALGEKISAKQ